MGERNGGADGRGRFDNNSRVKIRSLLALLAAAPLLASDRGHRDLKPPAPEGKPSLLLITLDTTRADHLGCYGYAGALTPNLDALAARGVRFENAYASAPITLSSHATIMTGTFPPKHGARDNGLFKLNPGVGTLAEALKKNGYRTAAFVSAAVLDRAFGLDRGFDFYDDNVRVGEQRAFSYQERAANQVTEAVVDYLPKLKAAGKPFFLWVHYYDAHFPYVAPNPFKSQFAKRPYDGEIAFVDANLGDLFEALKAQGLDQNLYTVAVGDHGEMLGEHGERNHGVFLYKSALHVPLIIAGPLAQGGTVEHGLFPLVDLRQLLVNYLVPPSFATARVQVTDENYEETFMPYFSYGFSPLMGLRVDHFHFIEAPTPELYDLTSDPGETNNLIAGAAGEKLHGEWSKKLAEILARSSGAHAAKGLPVPNSNADPELLKALAQLGYVGNAGGGARNLPDPKSVIDVLELLRRGEALDGEGRFLESIPLYEAVLRRVPGNFNAYGLLGSARLAVRQHGEALKVYRAGLALNPRLDFLRLGEARALAGLRDPAAEGKYRALIADQPRLADGWMAYHEFLSERGRDAEARKTLEGALAAGHDDAEIRYRLGEDEYRNRKPAAAEAQFRKAVAFNKYHAEALARLGELTAKRKPAEAAGFYRRALDERPDRQDWRAALAKLPGGK